MDSRSAVMSTYRSLRSRLNPSVVTRVATLLLLALSAQSFAQLAPSGWPKTYGDLQNTGRSPGGNTLPTKLWVSIGGGNLPPVIGLNGLVYSGLRAYDGSTGALIWSQPLQNSVYPVIGNDGTLYTSFGGSYGSQYLGAFDGATGQQKWVYDTIGTGTVRLNETVSMGPGPTVYLTGRPLASNEAWSSLDAFDAVTGAKKWSFRRQFSPGAGIVSVTDPAVGNDGTLYVGQIEGTHTGFVYALNPLDGTPIWKTNPVETYGLQPSAPPCLGPDGTVYVPSVEGPDPTDNKQLYAFNGETGAVKWVVSTGQAVVSTPALSKDGTLFYVSTDRHLYAVDSKDGSPKWSFACPGTNFFNAGRSSPCLGSDGLIYASFGDSSIYAINAITGSLVWSIDSISGSNPALGVDGRLYAQNFGDVVALESIHVISIKMSPVTVLGGTSSTGTVTLNFPAPAGGLQVGLSSDTKVATVPAFITVPEGQTTQTFTATTVPVSVKTVAGITASPGLNQTAALTITPAPLVSVSLNPTTVSSGGTSTGTLTLGGPAGSTAVVVNLSSDNSAATVPVSASIAPGKTSGTFTVNTTGVSSPTVANISATLNSVTVSAALNVTPASLQSVTLNPVSVVGGNTSTGTVTLGGPAGSGGISVALTSSTASATVPSTVTVAEGKTTATFSVQTIGVDSTTPATITATLNGQSQTGTLSILPAGLTSLSLSPSTVHGGSPSTGTLTLNGQAGPSGLAVSLSSDLPAATVGTPFTVPAGKTTGTFTVSTSGVNAQAIANISATLSGITQSAKLTITPNTLVSVTLSPSSVLGGNASTGTVTLSGPAGPGGTSISLTSSSASATVPSSVTIASGSTTATFAVSTSPVNAQVTSTITASLSSVNQTATLTITPPSLLALSLNPSTVQGGTSSTGTVSLDGPAGPSGVTLSLSSSNSSASVPASVSVASGQKTATFNVSTTGVNAQTTATITASLNSTSQTASLTITPASLVSVSLNPTTVPGGTPSTGTVTLSGPAGSGGTSVSLSSSTSSASVPASVSVASGQKTATFNVSTTGVNAQTTATITASLNSTSQTATLTITSSNLVSIAINPSSVIGGNSSTGTVTLSGPAGSGGALVSLSSSTSSASVPASVSVPSGQKSATFNVSTSGVSSQTTATITASLNSVSQTATLTITGASLLSVSTSPSSVIGGVMVTGTVTLSGNAGPGGAMVSLSSGSAIAKVPASVLVAPSASSVNFSIATSTVTASTQVVLTAKLGSVTQTTTLTVRPVSLQSLSLNPDSVPGGTPSMGTVNLNGPAPKGGLSVHLTSGNSSAAVPAAVSILAGQTSASFKVTTLAVPFQKVVAITGKLGTISVSANLTINPATLSAIKMNPAVVVGGAVSTGTVSLTGPAPAGGFVVKLSSSSKAAPVPVSVTVAAGKTSATFVTKTLAVGSLTSSTMGASLNGIVVTTTLVIDPPAITALTVNPATVVGGKNATGTVSIGSAAPTGGLTISLSSSDPAAKTPVTVTILAGKTSATFTIQTTKVTAKTKATISTSEGSSSKSAVLTIS